MLYHLDAYRISGADDFEAIGFGELLEQKGVIAVEWPSRVAASLPAKVIRVSITATSESSRQIEIDSAVG